MDNFLKIATNRNSLKALTKDFYIDELEKLANNINIIIEQRKEREAKLKEKHKEKIQKIENIKTLLSEQGLSVDDLINDPVATTNTPSNPKKKLKPKYRIIDLDGETHEWTGRGRAPKAFKKYFELGHPKESCLITDNITL
jgi:DNA-binding protein H-NS